MARSLQEEGTFLSLQATSLHAVGIKISAVKGRSGGFLPLLLLDHKCREGMIESLRLEMTSKIVKSNRQPTTTMPARELVGWKLSSQHAPENECSFVTAIWLQ